MNEGVSPQEAICDRFEAAWRSDQRPSIEDYWDKANGPALFRELLVVELAYRLRLGEHPDPADYLARFPELGGAVRDAFAALSPTTHPLARPVATANADRNLLFGVLAMQMNFVSREALIAAVSMWVLDKSKPLDRVLVEQGALAADERDLLDPLIRKHLERHGGDPERSLAAVGALGATRDDLARVADPELHASLAHLATTTGPDGAPTLILPLTLGTSTSSGLRFRILRLVAKGGLGEVFVARDEELRREVALKAIQEKHADDPVSRSRFRLEAEITGQLEHPGIIPVYGLGSDDQGRPFYAMRFIRGESLKDSIARFHQSESSARDPGERTLALRELLGRFIDVCNAMAYSHGRGVLHRDLKPANVMLGPYGETLVVDWGLAKVAGQSGSTEVGTVDGTPRPESGNDCDATQPGAWLGTPAYMSPEQAAGRIDMLGPSSDIYSLGATLYHLLTGRSPFENEDVFATLMKVRQGAFPSPRSINGRIPRALEAICLRAMALEIADRYPSAKALADDVKHWLADEAVSSHREPPIARLARWSRRHRAEVAGLAAILVTAVTALSISTVLISREAARKEEQRQLAEKNFGLARDAVDRMLTEVAEVDLADVPQMQQVRKRILEKARQFYQQFLKQKGTDASVLREAGRAHLRLGQIGELLGDHVEAERAYRRGLDLLTPLVRDDHDPPEILADLARGRDELGMLLKKANRFKESETLLRSALQLRERLAADHPRDPAHQQGLADSRYHLAALFSRLRGMRDEDEASYREALRVQESLVAGSRDRPEFRGKLARYLNNLALLLASTGRVVEAEEKYRESVSILTPLVSAPLPAPGDRWQLARSYANLAMLLRSSGRPDEAVTACLQARTLQQALRADFPDVLDYQHELASILNNLGLLRKEAGRLDDALSAFREAIELQYSLVAGSLQRPDYRLSLAVTRLNLASVLESTDVREATRIYRDALSVQEHLTADFPDVAEYQSAQGRTLYSLARLQLGEGGDGAVVLLDRAIRQHRLALENDPRDRAVREFLRDDFSVLCLALLRSVAHERAAKTAEELPKILPDDLSEYLRAAAFLVESADSASSDPVLTDARRKEVAESYAVRAVGLLRQAADRRLLADPDALRIKELAPLRSREDFERLRQSLFERGKVRDG
jgi:eukaryotic-like serine/threonine-protein kinase